MISYWSWNLQCISLIALKENMRIFKFWMFSFDIKVWTLTKEWPKGDGTLVKWGRAPDEKDLPEGTLSVEAKQDLHLYFGYSHLPDLIIETETD